MKMIRFFFPLVLIVLFCSNLFAQPVKSYEAQWKKVDDLIQQRNLPRTALTEVKKIYELAKKEKQQAQIIKALVYMATLQQQNREDNQKLSIVEIEKELPQHSEPAASILKSYLATLYLQYFQNHRWQLYSRTNTVNFVKNDLATWTIEDFHARISELYLQSINHEKLLQQTSLAAFDALIIKGNVRHLRPTLYDLLAHKALQYFTSGERDIKKPAYAFSIEQPQAFAPAADFVKAKFVTKDSASLFFKALSVYQRLIAFHLNDSKPDALVDADIARVQFVYQNAALENKDELYVAALQAIGQKHGSNPAAAQARYLLALYHHNLASRYQPLGDTSHRYQRVKAKEILEQVVRDSAIKYEGWVNSYNLLQEIDKKEFWFETEKVNLPEKPFRTLVGYRNINALHFRLIQATTEIKKLLLTNRNDTYWSALRSATAIRSWQQALPATGDLQNHSVEVKIDPLLVGEYFLIASTDASFNAGNNLGAQLFHVSNISYIGRGNKFFLLHRETGQPLANASVEVYSQEYDYKTSTYIKTKKGDYRSNKNGFVNVGQNKTGQDRGYTLKITHGNDRLFLDDLIYNYYYEGTERDFNERRMFLFTDRSIYRPGQSVFFKAIVISRSKEGSYINSNFATTVFLRNVNYEVVDSMKVTTNDFGSFNGKFILPQNLLNGVFYLMDKDGTNMMHFSVEEYKRPKFYVQFDKIKSSYKAGEQVVLTGSARAFAGNNIDGAVVNYRVVREPRFLYPWLWRIWPPQGEPMEIAHGTTTTDNQGNFAIRFTAIPDKQIDRRFDPVFDYHVYSDVTDASGETRSGETHVSAGYKSLIIKVALPERIDADSLNTISIRTENMNGEFQRSTVSVSFSPLIPEQRLVHKRYWQQPDQFIMSKEEFVQNFPHDEYRNETNFNTWPKDAAVLSISDTTSNTSVFAIPRGRLKPGFYAVEISTTDKDGNVVKDVRYVEIYDGKSNKLNRPEYLWTKGSSPIEPGEKTIVEVGSSAPDIFLLKQVEKMETSSQDAEIVTLNNERKKFEFTATEKDRGGYGASFFFVKDNRFFQYNEIIRVPWSNKELKVDFVTYRDKTLPGNDETWKIKISGYKNEKVAAEVLASMYDASLDQFKPHGWEQPQIWPQYMPKFGWQATQNFTSVRSAQDFENSNHHPNYEKIYDRFFFDNTFYSGGIARRGEMQEAMVSAPVDQMSSKGEMAKPLPPAADAKLQAADTVGYANQGQFQTDFSQVAVRKNFNETAFFLPELKTDKDGNIEFSFTTPEALTRWKLQLLAHTKELAFGMAQKEIITQKELMVQPNAPRFLRQGDEVELSTRIANISEQELSGQVMLQLFDAVSNQPVDAAFSNTNKLQSFKIAAGQSTALGFKIIIPPTFTSALLWRIVATAGNVSDGEEMALPVLSNKLLVTETMPLPMRGSGTKNFSFEKLLKSGGSSSLQHHALTVEYTANPAWYAVQALPYLMEQSNETVEQTWNRYYANSLATKIINAAPRIKQIFERWASNTIDTAALLSNLQKNQEFKSALLEETPWVLDAKNETQQKKNIALLFDLVRMTNELQAAFKKLKEFQSPNGGFFWCKGAPEDRYMTQYIVTGIGHLKKLNAIVAGQQDEMNSVLRTAIPYIDMKLREDYQYLMKNKSVNDKHIPGYTQIQYLYMRSFFTEVAIPQSVQAAYNFYRQQAFRTWMKQNKYMQGMIALALHRTKDLQTPQDILRSLKETAIVDEEMGMYWQHQKFGYSWLWWHAPIETQALLIEAFTEISKDMKAIDDMRTWLIKNKQTNNWRTSKATAEAVYAFLLHGTEWLTNEPSVEIKLGSTVFSSSKNAEAGTGYFKQTLEGKQVNPSMGKITVNVQQTTDNQGIQQITSPSWGAVYWQYFEDMDKITSAETPLKLSKKLFIEKNSDRGPVLTPVTNALKIGDKVKVRIELRVDRDMEYFHMKDLRASAFEPVNVISGYKWQGGLGYYETTKDVSTSFYFPYLRRGTYVFEYPLFVTHAGEFSNGITSIQCFYAPEFSAHSEGIRVKVVR